LTQLTKEGRWDELSDVIDDEVLNTFAVVGNPDEVGRGLRARWGDVADRISLYATYQTDPSMWPAVLDAVRG
jgi:hypothetical protein